MKEFIDASIFLGMHSPDKKTRIACKNYFVNRLEDKIGMSLEQVGICDDVIWRYSREEQDIYYPFMDNLHTIMSIQRVSYNEKDIHEATTNPDLQNLGITDKLTIGMVLASGAKLYSINPKLTGRNYVLYPEAGKELAFPSKLEKLYKQSLEVKICIKE